MEFEKTYQEHTQMLLDIMNTGNFLDSVLKNGVSNRNQKMPESTFVLRRLDRVGEDTVETKEVIHAFTKSRAISKSSEVTSSIHQVLMVNNLDTRFLEQLERSLPGETTSQLEDKFEGRLITCFLTYWLIY